ncbi:MAG: amidase [Chloroflexi bacterium]|nr:amidase [Chloroflexota bacterium]
MDELVSRSAASMARAVRNREVSSVELVEAHLRRIDAVNPSLNAIIHLDAAGALAAARTADARLADGAPAGPLHGVPVTVKDNLDVAGLPCTGGTRGRAGCVPGQDATVVARLRAAGAVILGKTNLPEMALAFVTDNLVHGRTNNPYDLARTPGGSSGGEAAIIAAGGSPLGVGNDLAGSIRLPAHFCGIAGLKPTSGRVPLTGYFSPIVGLLKPLWHNGPMARRVEDLALGLAVMAGPDGRDPGAVPAPQGDPTAVDLRAPRIAVHADNGIASPSPETVAAIGRAADALRDVGVQVVEERPAALADAPGLFHRLFNADAGTRLRAEIAALGTTATDMHPAMSGLLDAVERSTGSVGDLTALLADLDRYRAAMLAFLTDYDAILCPVDTEAARPHGPVRGNSYAYPYNLTGWPAAVVRAGASATGLPIGVQIVARPWREDVALALASAVEAGTGGWLPPPL